MKKLNNISEIYLEKYILGELPQEEMLRIENEISQNTFLAEKINTIKKSNDNILKEYPSEYFENLIEQKSKSKILNSNTQKKEKFFPKLTKKSSVLAAAVLCCMTAIFILFINPFNGTQENIIQNGTRFKGDSRKLFIYKKTDSGTELLKPGTHVSQNDLIQVAYFSANDRYGMIISIDGNKNITLHYPGENKNTELKTKKTIPLENSYKLDNAPEYEIFYLITASKPIDINYILTRIDINVKMSGNMFNNDLGLTDSYNIVKYPLLKR